MTTGAPAHVGYVHEAAIYDSPDELLQVVVPHLQDAIAAGEPAFASLPTDEAALVRHAMGGASGATFLPARGPSERPTTVIKTLRSMLGDLVANGAEQVRFVSTVPHPGTGAPWDGWCRYEAAINNLLGDMPLWDLCVYDRRITPAGVLADVERTHPRLASTDGSHLHNDRYQDPNVFLRTMQPPPLDPLEAAPPTVELVNPTPTAGRHAVQTVAQRTHLDRDDVEALVTATSEVVTNAINHGRPPVTLKLWAAPQRIVVTVTDRGEGPQDPYVGLVPQPGAAIGNGGYGLWIVHQLTAVTYSRDTEGFTVHLLAGRAVT